MQRSEAALRENQEPVQLLLPMVEIALAMKQGVGTLIRQAGLQFDAVSDGAEGGTDARSAL